MDSFHKIRSCKKKCWSKKIILAGMERTTNRRPSWLRQSRQSCEQV